MTVIQSPSELLQEYLHGWTKYGGKASINGYSCQADFILRNGRSFEPSTDARCLHLGMKQCFWNSARLAMKDRRYTFCEGYAVSMIPCHHAWVVDENGVLIETTWNEPGAAYFGIPFRTDYLRAQIRKHKHCSMIDQWEADVPTIRSNKETWYREL